MTLLECNVSHIALVAMSVAECVTHGTGDDVRRITSFLHPGIHLRPTSESVASAVHANDVPSLVLC